MEERQGPLAAGWGLGVTALLPRQVQLGIGEGRVRHGVKYLQNSFIKRLHATVNWGDSTGPDKYDQKA